MLRIGKLILVTAQDVPEDEPYTAVVFPDGQWMPLFVLERVVDTIVPLISGHPCAQCGAYLDHFDHCSLIAAY